MKKIVIRKFECVDRVKLFGDKPELAPLGTKEAALFTSLTPIVAAGITFGANQESGNRGYREGAFERGSVATELHTSLRDIAEIAKALREEGVDVGAAEAFRMPDRYPYASLAAAALGFVNTVESRKAAFIERGLATTFVEDMEALIADLTSANNVRQGGLSKQVGGTAGLEAIADQGMKVVRQLRAIMRVKLRSQPGLLAEWQAASRVHRSIAEPAPTTPPPDPGSSSGTGSGTASGTTAGLTTTLTQGGIIA